MGVGLTSSSSIGKKFGCRSSPPGAEATRRPSKNDVGGVIELELDREEIWLQNLSPLGRRGNGTPMKGRWGRVNELDVDRKKIFGCRTYPPCGRGNGTPPKGRW